MALEGFINARKKLPSGSVYDVKFSDLVRDPIAVVRELYAQLGHDCTAEAEDRMRTFLSKHSHGQYGSHSYAMASYGLDPAEVSERFNLYRERFGLTNIR